MPCVKHTKRKIPIHEYGNITLANFSEALEFSEQQRFSEVLATFDLGQRKKKFKLTPKKEFEEEDEESGILVEDGYFCDECHELALQGGFHYDLALHNDNDLVKAQEVDVGDVVTFKMESDEILGVVSRKQTFFQIAVPRQGAPKGRDVVHTISVEDHDLKKSEKICTYIPHQKTKNIIANVVSPKATYDILD